jgi:hypothetical protein
VTLVVVKVATVLVVRSLRRSSGDGNINLLDGDLKDLAVLGDVLGGDDLALGVVGGIVDGRRGGDGGSGDLLLAGGRGDDGGRLGVLGGRAGLGGGVVRVLLVVTEDGGRSLAKEAVVAGSRRCGLAGLASLGAGSGNGILAPAGVSGGVLGTVLHGNALGDTLVLVNHILVDKNLGDLESALAGLGITLDVEQRAVLDQSRVALASVESLLEEVLGLPAHHEVTVVSSTSRVTVRKRELTILADESVGGPDGLEEEEGVVDVVSLGALALLDQVRVGNVGLVVVRVGLASTAARETDLETHAASAVLVHVLFGRQLVAVERGLGQVGSAVVEAVEAESSLGQPFLVGGLLRPGGERLVGERAVEGAAVLVTSDHLEALGEGLHVVHVVQVVGEKATDLGNDDGGAVVVDEVEGGSPVSGLVLGDGARGAGTLGGQVLVGSVHVEVLGRRSARSQVNLFISNTYFRYQRWCGRGQRWFPCP